MEFIGLRCAKVSKRLVISQLLITNLNEDMIVAVLIAI